MSLINQMLKDLEQRGAEVTDVMVADTKNIITNKPNVSPQARQLLPRKRGISLIKISGLMALLLGGAYLWTQSGHALSRNVEMAKAMIADLKPQPVVNTVKSTSTVKLEIPAAKLPNTAPVNTKLATIEPPPIFESELKYNPVPAQSNKPEKENATANLVPDVTATKPVKPLKSTQTIEPAKLLPTENLSATGRLVSELPPKSNTDKTSTGKQISSAQQSSNYYRQALSNLQQGRVAEAQANLTQALEANPANQEARQTLAGLLLDNKRNDEAKATLMAGLVISPEQSDFRMAIARLQIETGDRTGALNTLEQGLIYAKDNADYQGFLATLLQRAERHEEAINHYMTALSLNNTAPNLLIGLGISLQAVGKLENAKDVFIRAQSTVNLNPELSLFVDQQLKQINQHLHNINSK